MIDKKKLLTEIKMLKGIRDFEQDDLLNLIIEDSIERIISYINVGRGEDDVYKEVPTPLTYVVRDVASKRFNRLNQEGAKKVSEEGSSFDWQDDYLKEYEHILHAYQKPPDEFIKPKGIARFI